MSNPKAQVILHIGAEKTGSTSLQKFLTLNRGELQSRGVLFPKAPGVENHVLLAIYSSPNANTDDLKAALNLHSKDALDEILSSLGEDLRQEALKSDCKFLVLSNEHCSSRLRNTSALLRLRQLILSFSESIRVILYVRRQDDLLLSTYSTSVKSGNTQPITKPNLHERFLFDYAAMLRLWSEVFGQSNIVVRVYGQSTLVNGDIISDFVETAQLPLSPTAAPRPGDWLNKSLDFSTLEFLRLFNKYVPFIIDGKLNPDRFDLLNALEQISAGKKTIISSAELDAFFHTFDASNAQVANAYLGKTDGHLFPERPNDEVRELATSLKVEEAVELATKIWVYANKTKAANAV